jgi:hypothetical protein
MEKVKRMAANEVLSAESSMPREEQEFGVFNQPALTQHPALRTQN